MLNRVKRKQTLHGRQLGNRINESVIANVDFVELLGFEALHRRISQRLDVGESRRIREFGYFVGHRVVTALQIISAFTADHEKFVFRG
ncbi:hypothetical protein D3C81_1622420 [compost metagenome]